MENRVKISVENLGFSYGRREILAGVTLQVHENSITAITGPSGAGKSTFLALMNRLGEAESGTRVKGTVHMVLDGEEVDIYHKRMDLPLLRRKVGMVFQIPNPLPMGIGANVAFPLKLAGMRGRDVTAERVESALTRAGLWQEVKDRLKDDARSLSGGQQQRLCMARALVSEPEILLLDEPTSSLDAESEAVIEELLLGLKNSCTLVMVSHSAGQVERLADAVYQVSERSFQLLA